MPLYEYFCEPCNGIFEELRPIREASDPVPCPECYSLPVPQGGADVPSTSRVP